MDWRRVLNSLGDRLLGLLLSQNLVDSHRLLLLLSHLLRRQLRLLHWKLACELGGCVLYWSSLNLSNRGGVPWRLRLLDFPQCWILCFLHVHSHHRARYSLSLVESLGRRSARLYRDQRLLLPASLNGLFQLGSGHAHYLLVVGRSYQIRREVRVHDFNGIASLEQVL